eukprot:gene23974-10094_t
MGKVTGAARGRTRPWTTTAAPELSHTRKVKFVVQEGQKSGV